MLCHLKPIWFLYNKCIIVNTLKTRLQNPQRLRSHRLLPQKEESCVFTSHAGRRGLHREIPRRRGCARHQATASRVWK